MPWHILHTNLAHSLEFVSFYKQSQKNDYHCDVKFYHHMFDLEFYNQVYNLSRLGFENSRAVEGSISLIFASWWLGPT